MRLKENIPMTTGKISEVDNNRWPNSFIVHKEANIGKSSSFMEDENKAIITGEELEKVSEFEIHMGKGKTNVHQYRELSGNNR